MRKKVLGFTLIELMIVIAIIAIIAAIAIPNLMRAKMASNETSASAGLKSVASAQAIFVKANTAHQTPVGEVYNEVGEAGLFNELSGYAPPRGGGPILKNPDLPASFNIPNGALASKGGYYYQMFLPHATMGTGLTDIGGTAAAPDATDLPTISQQENHWISYAWPISYRSSGVKAFVVDNTATVYASLNTDNANNGFFFGTLAANMPLYNSAMSTQPTAPTSLEFTNIAVKEQTNIVDNRHLWTVSE